MDLHRQRKNIINVELTDDLLHTGQEEEAFDETLAQAAKPYQEYIKTWEWYDRHLFMIYVNEKISMRKLAKETGIGFMSIYHTIKLCKNRLKKIQQANQQPA